MSRIDCASASTLAWSRARRRALTSICEIGSCTTAFRGAESVGAPRRTGLAHSLRGFRGCAGVPSLRGRPRLFSSGRFLLVSGAGLVHASASLLFPYRAAKSPSALLQPPAACHSAALWHFCCGALTVAVYFFRVKPGLA